MRTDRRHTRPGAPVRRFGVVLAVLALTLLVVAMAPGTALAKNKNAYVVTPLISDVSTWAPTLDANLVNGWGLAAGPTTPWWVADNGSDLSTVYTGTGEVRPLAVSVMSAPTGVVFNDAAGFKVVSGEESGTARFIFATEDGTILGWNSAVPSAGSTTAIVAVDRSGVGAVYKGLAIGMVAGQPYLYATDFVNGRIDVFGGDWSLQSWTGAFKTRKVPRGYAPFGIQAIGDKIFVTYAKQNPPSTDEKAGHGRGFVVEYTMSGAYVAVVARRGKLNAPWGLAMAPATGFGKFSGCLLVGNFGDGHINAYRANRHGRHWTFKGTLRTTRGKKLTIDGLWGIAFGHGAETLSGPATTLYFAAGPSDESHGLFGTVMKK